MNSVISCNEVYWDTSLGTCMLFPGEIKSKAISKALIKFSTYEIWKRGMRCLKYMQFYEFNL